ncbi:MAG TPA: NADH-quinone oxidoreductase subunit G, partial [Actinomycetales bacterium]|nr:NADH-quinone oxidoreductase subunit G [Actinomycetales bacterium]
VKTQHSSEVADKAQHGMIEFLLINHPLDCPTCDKGGECPLQNQAMSNGSATSRFRDQKRTFAKPLAISTQILLDRERCIMCQRCTRFQEEIAGDPFIDLQERGAQQQIGTFNADLLGFEKDQPGAGLRDDLVTDSAVRRTSPGGAPGLPGAGDQPVGSAAADISGRPFSSYFSRNTIQICPVGALTNSAYRFRSRPFDLVSTPAIAEHDACGAAIRIDHRAGKVLRRQAGEDYAVNEEWISDKDRFAFPWQRATDRITRPLVRNTESGELEPTTWQEALHVAAEGLKQAQAAGGVGVLPGGRLTVEDAYAYSKFARTVLGTNDVDFRSRPHSVEEEAFLAHAVAGTGMGVTYADVENASVVLLLGFEPEDEAATIWLRLRKANRRKNLAVYSVGPFESRGLKKVNGRLIAAAPGTEAEVIDAISAGKKTSGSSAETISELRDLLAQPGAVVLAGERLASTPGALSSTLALVEATNAALAWVPRRAGDRGAVEAGLLPQLLPGGRAVSDAQARVDAGAVWGVDSLPTEPGRNISEILEAAAANELGGLLIGGVETADLPNPEQARAAIAAAGFVLSLEVRSSDVTAFADVVLPVAPPSEKQGTYLNWEGRVRSFGRALESNAMSDHRVLSAVADEMDEYLGLQSADIALAELGEFHAWEGERIAAPTTSSGEVPTINAGQAVLATWQQLLDLGRSQDGEPYLAGTQRLPVARVSAQTAAASSIIDGSLIEISNEHGQITLPVVITDMPDGVVWVPTRSPGSEVRETLRADAGAVVQIASGTAPEISAEQKEVVA